MRTIGTIKKLDHERGLATVDVSGRSLRVDLKEPRALDHAYAVTSHKSQGLSRERVYLTVDTSHSDELVNRRQFYVSVSRAVEDARVYTDDRLALARAVSREPGRESALEVLDHERLRTIVALLAMLVGGFLGGQVVSWRSGAMESARPAAIEQGTSASKAAPAAPRRSAGQGIRPTAKPAR